MPRWGTRARTGATVGYTGQTAKYSGEQCKTAKYSGEQCQTPKTTWYSGQTAKTTWYSGQTAKYSGEQCQTAKYSGEQCQTPYPDPYHGTPPGIDRPAPPPCPRVPPPRHDGSHGVTGPVHGLNDTDARTRMSENGKLVPKGCCNK